MAWFFIFDSLYRRVVQLSLELFSCRWSCSVVIGVVSVVVGVVQFSLELFSCRWSCSVVVGVVSVVVGVVQFSLELFSCRWSCSVIVAVELWKRFRSDVRIMDHRSMMIRNILSQFPSSEERKRQRHPKDWWTSDNIEKPPHLSHVHNSLLAVRWQNHLKIDWWQTYHTWSDICTPLSPPDMSWQGLESIHTKDQVSWFCPTRLWAHPATSWITINCNSI